ncbi:hypothetical protein KIL84_006288 [Mauremys mutica]|uniref:Uncharacterized protein n=1 Tax=Mauremys mutica TaxID=74926 RepID=A0A9D4AW15_9SAUR|nr:hypothetical protein KIL84_006288 [Mauremys mutica]
MSAEFGWSQFSSQVLHRVEGCGSVPGPKGWGALGHGYTADTVSGLFPQHRSHTPPIPRLAPPAGGASKRCCRGGGWSLGERLVPTAPKPVPTASLHSCSLPTGVFFLF